MRSSAPRAVGEILSTAVPQLMPRLVEQAVRRQWRSLVGFELARRAQPRVLSGDCLEVVVDNSPWLHELTLRAPQIVAAIGRELGPGTVRSLKVTLGRLEAEAPPSVRPPAEPARRVTEAERRAIDQAVAPVADLVLAASLRRLLVKSGRFS
jgi:Dna[CI] antecedent DciA-like protein